MTKYLTWNRNNYASNLYQLRMGSYYVIPKPKFLFYVDFKVSPQARNLLGANDQLRKLGFIVRTQDRPSIQYQQQELNQYNRKRLVTTGISYGSVTITLNDTVDETALKLMEDYSSYYYHDFNYGAGGYKYDIYPPTNRTASAGYGPRGGASDIYFFESIDVYEFYNGYYTKYRLMNPKFENVNFGSNDMQSSEGNEVSFVVRPEGVVYEAISAEITQKISDKLGLPFREGSTKNFRMHKDTRIVGEGMPQTHDQPTFLDYKIGGLGSFVSNTLGNLTGGFDLTGGLSLGLNTSFGNFGFSLGGSVGGDAKVQIGRDISASVSGRIF